MILKTNIYADCRTFYVDNPLRAPMVDNILILFKYRDQTFTN